MKRARDPKALREVMGARGLSYRQLGKLADCSHSTPYLLVQGKPTSNELAVRVAKALGRRVEELFETVESSDEQRPDQQGAVA